MSRGARRSPRFDILLLLRVDQNEQGKGGKMSLLIVFPFWFVVKFCVYELMISDLPGLYYDPVKNRYFPVKARGALSTAAPARSNQPEPNSESEICNRNYIKTLKLLEGRELHGRYSITQPNKLSFQQQYQISQASAPIVWKYQNTDGIVDSSMEHFTSFVQTPQGQKRTGILAMGNMAGSISIYEVGKFGHLGFGTVRTPVYLRPQRAIEDYERPEYIRACEGYVIPLFSSVSCITRRKKKLLANDQLSSDHSCALVSSLGSGGSGGSVYILDFAKSLDLHQDAPSLHSRLVKVASTNCTIWSADSNCDGTRAVIGTNRGAALLHLERRELSWICRTKSDILSLQFDHSGNIVLCGLRNGAIIIVDIRQRNFNSLDNSSRSWSSMEQKLSNHGLQVSKHLGTWLKGGVRPIGAAFMPSAVCSLTTLYSYGHYFLASSMDGSVGLFDSRLLQQGAVHYYEGHANSHSRLQIGVDPTETFFLAGGEDCCMRIWSIKTGKLLYGSRISSSPVVAMCWPQNESVLPASDESRASSGVEFEMEPLELTHSWAAWLGSLEGLFYIHGS